MGGFFFVFVEEAEKLVGAERGMERREGRNGEGRKPGRRGEERDTSRGKNGKRRREKRLRKVKNNLPAAQDLCVNADVYHLALSLSSVYHPSLLREGNEAAEMIT